MAEALAAAEAVARTANEAKNQFLSRMSHELRTPLNAVIGFGQLLQMQLAETEHAEGIEQILRGGRHLLHLINDVLDISSIEAGESSISTEPVAVGGLLVETMQLMVPLADEVGVTSHSGDRGDRLHRPRRSPAAAADPAQPARECGEVQPTGRRGLDRTRGPRGRRSPLPSTTTAQASRTRCRVACSFRSIGSVPKAAESTAPASASR